MLESDSVVAAMRALVTEHTYWKVERAGDKLVVRGPRRAEPVVKLLAEHKTEVLAALAAPPGFARVVPLIDSEPALEQPCAARRGRVQELDKTFLHFCYQCGRFAAFAAMAPFCEQATLAAGIAASIGRNQFCQPEISERSRRKPTSNRGIHGVCHLSRSQSIRRLL